ncbi:Tectonin beta-propeller repeat-containing protein 1 [Hondaea fermentalgiana]|uniref:Tectonin beta-propeller repeat-containing protein 1 n=1 Tax=Hondaea fermentalgiana TaxID=2315210 RepID=A0A2R5GGD6_9STRA|nr:Tectonin beta-propeller repeat-containing protein 1 [Hondaea fermentalgiana]|eukprot:GBG27321.1 Tectonin beta-propeller repeat-containing protein 1 [Hondaea fermentalgiana]
MPARKLSKAATNRTSREREMIRASMRNLRGTLSFKQKALSNEEVDLERRVDDMLWEGMVLGISDEYGLKWRFGSADEPREAIGGWLFQVSRDAVTKKKQKGRLAFFVIDDIAENLCQVKDEWATSTQRQISFSEIIAVRARISTSGFVYVRVYTRRNHDWLMMPVQSDNEDIVVRWVAALRHRARILNAEQERDLEDATRVAIWAQSIARMRNAQAKADRRRERRNGLLKRLGAAIYGYPDTDSEDEGEDEDLVPRRPMQAVSSIYERGSTRVSSTRRTFTRATRTSTVRTAPPAEPASPFLVTFVSALAADWYDLAFGAASASDATNQAGTGARSTQKSPRRSVFKPKLTLSEAAWNQISQFDDSYDEDEEDLETDEDHQRGTLLSNPTFVQDTFTIKPLEAGEIEDELWENERYGLKKGWSAEALLATDRWHFTDRIGRGQLESLDELEVPEGFEITTDWTLDVSGSISGQCGADGWTYAMDFGPLDSNLAKGTPRIATTISTVVRHRRWYRRRMPIRQSRIESPVIWHGWLGRRSSGTGRWQCRYFVLTQGLRLHGKITGIALSYFRFDFPNHLELVGSLDLDAWNQLTRHELRTWSLDGAVVINKNDPSQQQTTGPYIFEVSLPQEKQPVKFTTNSLISRENWIGAIEFALRDQVKRFTLTKSMELPLEGAFLDTPQYCNLILDRLLPLRVDECFDLLYFDDEFHENFFESCKFEVELEEPWSLDTQIGSRRKIVYRTPKRKVYAGHEVIAKDKLVRSDPGAGYQVDSSLQSPESPYGNIYQDEIRVVLVDWKNKMTRIIITHQVDLRAEDESVRVFVESNARRQVLAHYVEDWLPYVQTVLKRRRHEQQQQQVTQLTIASPSGIAYRVDEEVSSIRPVNPRYNY